MKIPQTNEDLKVHLAEQLKFLETSADAYDQGNESEAKRMAATIRLLVRETPNTHSLLQQLELEKVKFISTCAPMLRPFNPPKRGLIYTSMGQGQSKHKAMLDLVNEIEELDFEKWWNQVVFAMEKINEKEEVEEITFTRKDIILTVADKDGGAHVDPSLEAKYHKLSRGNLLGELWGEDNKWVPYGNPARATIRQIGHEILKTFVKNYSKQPDLQGSGLIIGNIDLGF